MRPLWTARCSRSPGAQPEGSTIEPEFGSTTAATADVAVGRPAVGSHGPVSSPIVTSTCVSTCRAPGGRSGDATVPIGPYNVDARQVAPV